VIFGQEESKYDVPPYMFGIGQGMLGPTIMAHGTDAQKERYIEPLLRADEVWCQLFSEPAAGSDLAGLRTSAVMDGDDWIVNGQKIWTTGAQYSDFGMIVTRTDPTAK
jgi:alkylation response protein AidB-like acyl-CoA dehydrogenase